MTKLDKGTVIAAALELLNEVGMDSLTTRKLAERLMFSSLRFTGISRTSERCLMRSPRRCWRNAIPARYPKRMRTGGCS